jgi:uncharacterized protein YpiB (UPF0302 family)
MAIKKNRPKDPDSFAQSAGKAESNAEYTQALTVRLSPDMAKTIKAIAYYERESQRETIERAMDALLKQMNPNDIKKALKMYDKQ